MRRLLLRWSRHRCPVPPEVLRQIILPCRCGYTMNVPLFINLNDPDLQHIKLGGPTHALLDHYDRCSENREL